MLKLTFTSFAALIFALSTCAQFAHAEGLLVPMLDKRAAPASVFTPPPVPDFQPRPFPLPPPVSRLPFRVTSSKVDVRIEENVATTSVEQTFLNLSGRDLEVKILYPLPAGASVNSSSLSMNDQMIEGRLYNAEEAARIYQSIVTQRKDPALLRYVGDNLFEASVFPVPPNQTRKLKFSYSQLLTATAGLYDFRHVLTTSQHYDQGMESFELTCTIHSASSIGPVYSASHQVDIQRPDVHTAVVKLNAAHLVSENDMHIYYSLGKGDVAFRVLAHRTSESEDGYFMLIGRADESLQNARMPSKEIVFVVDTSGSMQGPKIKQTRSALKFCINSLHEKDRFNLITFSTDVSAPVGDNLKPATPENVNRALAAVDQIEASGGTNIDAALHAAMGSDFSSGSGNAKMIVFMTDGLPTNGVTDMAEILKGIKSANSAQHVRFFNFGVGDDVNTYLLDQLAQDQEGTCTYVSPREDIEIKVSDFFSKVKNPVMTDAHFDFASSGANSIYPKKIPALFKGGEFILLGRYKGTGPGEVVLTGNVAGETRRIAVPVEWPARTLDHSFLPRIWAMRKIGHLLESMRLNGSNQEIINEVVELATRHGIVTPYTSQLVLEPNMPVPTAGVPPQTSRPAAPTDAFGFQREAKKATERAALAVAKSALTEQTGESATGLASLEKQLQNVSSNAVNNTGAADASEFRTALESEGLKREYQRQLGGALRLDKSKAPRSEEESYALALKVDEGQKDLIRNVVGRTFYLRHGTWVDSQAKSDAKPTVIKQFSTEYFDLLKKDADFGAVLALGGTILIADGSKVYQIEE